MVAVQLPVKPFDRLAGILVGTVQVPDRLFGAGGGVDVKTPIPICGDGGRTPIAAAKVGGDAVARPVGVTINSFRESANGD